MKTKIKNLVLQNRIITAVVVGVGIIGGGYWYVSANAAPSFDSIAPQRGTVVQSVDESGTVLAENSVAASFQEGGQIAHVYVNEGDTVAAGALLADLDQAQLAASLSQSQAALSAAQAKLDSLESGTREEQLAIDNGALANASAGLSASALNAYSAADDAVRNQIDNMFTSPESNNPIFIIPGASSQAQINIETSRVSIGTTLNRWYAALNGSTTDPAVLSVTADASLRGVQSYLNTVALVVNAATANLGIPSATLAGYKANVVAARTEVTAAVNALTAAETAYTNAKNTLALAQAGTTAQDIEAQKAAVLQAQAGAQGAQVALDRASLRAPFAGTVQDLTGKIGQVVTPGGPVLSIVNNSGLKIEIFVSESDVAKITEGDKADVTLDAYGTGTMFPATVTTVDNSKTAVNGSPAYKVTLHFANRDTRIKDGMTANVRVIAAEHDNVLAVPTRLIVSTGGKNVVLVKNGSATEQRAIETGISGDNGMTEVISGLNESDRLINF